MRRIKICTESPLPPLKAWFPIKDTVETIYQLKYNLVHDLAVLVQGGHKRNDINLEIDGFGLLDGSSVSILNFDTDVLHIKLSVSPAETRRKKRKLSDAPIVPAKKQKMREPSATVDRVSAGENRPSVTKGKNGVLAETVAHDKKATRRKPIPSQKGQSSDSSSSSSSSPSDSSDNSTSSSSSSSSSSESETDTDSDPPPAKNMAISTQSRLAVAAIGSTPTCVSPNIGTPPGSGKKSTRERNLRRRASRKAQKGASPLPNDLGPAMPVSKPPSKFLEEVSNVVSTLPTPRAMANKNKKRGFLQTMEGATGRRTVYSDPGDAAEVAQQLLTVSPAEQPSKPADLPFSPARPFEISAGEGSFSGKSPMRLPPLPPSRMTRLASNLIITSKWFSVPSRQEAMKEIKKEAQQLATARAGLDLAQPATGASTDLTSLKGWNDMVEKFEQLAPITTQTVENLQKGVLVAWKSLELNQETWQPELCVQFGHIIRIDDSDATIAPLSRPIEILRDNIELDPEAGEVAETEAEVEQTVKVSAFCEGDYRIV